MFEGESDRLRFVNVEPPYLAGAPYLAYDYAVVAGSGTYEIELRRAPIDPEALTLDVVGAVEPRTVLRLTRPVQFSYWGSLTPRDRPSWHAEWPPGTELPEAIRLAASEAPGWPELVVPLRITAPWHCAGGGGGTAGTVGCPGVRDGQGDAAATPGRTPLGDRQSGFGRPGSDLPR